MNVQETTGTVNRDAKIIREVSDAVVSLDIAWIGWQGDAQVCCKLIDPNIVSLSVSPTRIRSNLHVG